MFPEPTELLLIGYLIESTWTPKSKSNTLTPKTNSQTYWPRENSHVMNGIIFCVCLTLAISILQNVLRWCRKERKKIQGKKESQQNRNQWWIWSRDAAKPLLSCYLLLHLKARGKPDTKVNLFWACKLRSTIEREDPLWTHSTDRFIVENDEKNSYTEAESELSLESISFLHGVNVQVRKRQNQSSKDATKDSDNHSVIWRMFMSSTLQASVFMVKNYWDNWHSIKNTGKDLTMKQMFDISEKLITEQTDEIYGIRTVNWEHSSWKYLSLVGGEKVISLSHTKVFVFSDCIMPWKDEREPTIKLCMGRQIDVVQKFIRIQKLGQNWWWANGIRVEYLPRIHHIAALPQSPRVTVKIECNTRKIYWTDYLHVDVQRHLMEI